MRSHGSPVTSDKCTQRNATKGRERCHLRVIEHIETEVEGDARCRVTRTARLTATNRDPWPRATPVNRRNASCPLMIIIVTDPVSMQLVVAAYAD